MSETIPLFPLGSLLFPGGRLSLQVFEPRYMDMIKRCLRDSSGFGVVGIKSGSEVAKPGAAAPELYNVGVLANIVDWSGLEHGRIAIVAEGERRFRVLSTEVQADYLTLAEVEFVEEQPEELLPVAYAELAGLLKQLALHPTVKQLGMGFSYTSADSVANGLGQLLPIPNSDKYRLLSSNDALEALAKISLITDRLSGR